MIINSTAQHISIEYHGVIDSETATNPSSSSHIARVTRVHNTNGGA